MKRAVFLHLPWAWRSPLARDGGRAGSSPAPDLSRSPAAAAAFANADTHCQPARQASTTFLALSIR